MEAVPLVPKAKVLPNLDAVPLLQELFQDEFQAVLPTKKLSQNILTSVQYQKVGDDDKETFKSVEFFASLTNRKDNVISFTENVLEAYLNHQKRLEEIRDVERHIFETHSHFLKREVAILGNRAVRDLLSLKRQPLLKSLDAEYVKKYKLLQGEAGLPLEYEVNSDFRVKNFKKWKKRLETSDQDDLVLEYLKRASAAPVDSGCKKLPLKSILPQVPKKVRKPRPKNKRVAENPVEIFKAEPKIVFFTDYRVGDVYAAEITVKNIHTKGVHFQLKPTCPDGPFRVTLNDTSSTKVFSGLSFQLTVEFTPKSLDNTAEDLVIVTEDGSKLLVPLIAYLEPPVLKTHKEVNECTKITAEKIVSSYIECGACFAGDTKVTKLRFRCYRGCGEFFIMSSENWNRSYINTVTSDNLLEIPPFQVYPVYFKMEKDEVIDLFVEFKPKNSGMHAESIVIVCDNGEIRFLDLLGDAVGWHSYYFSFQDSLLKTLSVDKDDDMKVKNYLDFEDCTSSGKVEKVFCVCNNSNMAFEFQWKIREANIQGQDKYMKLSKFEVKIDPENGTIEANSIWEFIVTITFNNADIGNYRMVLSLYVLNLPYQSIEEDNTIIQPTGLVRNLYSQSLYGEEEGLISSPELASLQGTYESLQESIKTYVECQTKAQAVFKNDFCRAVCIPNPGLCAKPLKKSKTFFNIGDNLEDEGLSCACRLRTAEPESNSESCISNVRDEKTNESSVQRNEIIWDFVDVLVDEVELWVEVVPTRVTLEPGVIEIGSSIKVNDPPIFKKVHIINHNRSPVTCCWAKPEEITSRTNKNEQILDKNQISLSLLFDKNLEKKEKVKQNSKNQINPLKHVDGGATTEKEDTENSDGRCGSCTKSEVNEFCRFIIKPQKKFLLAGCSFQICEIGISACREGNIKETLYLSVNEGDLELKLLILGSAEAEKFQISPDIINFGLLKQGTRYTKNFEVINTGQDSLFWRVKKYNFHFVEDKFTVLPEITDSNSTKWIAHSKKNSDSFTLNARMPGVKCTLLEIQGKKSKASKLIEKYVFVLANVKEPKLLLSAPRFENAILSPAGALYVGQKISTRISLTNIGAVETFVTWGNPFGCHSRKIKIDINPKNFRIEQKKKLTIGVELTALEEGIISHCYIPCFFCRRTEPLILSVVALAENVNVTFEIIDYPLQSHADPKTFLKSPFHHTVLRVPWPLKIYNSTLSKKYLNETDVKNMKCKCLEVEEQACRAFDEQKQETVPELAASEKSVQSLLSFETGDENSLKSKSSLVKNKMSYEDDLKLGTPVLSAYTESKKSEEISQSISALTESSSDIFRFVKPELEFLNVPFRTPMLRQFVIRNETPIDTCFQINVLNYGVGKNLVSTRVEAIKNKVMGYSKDAFESKLMKHQPLVIVVEPSHGELKGSDAVSINVFCYSNTWGEYRDFLICQVKGTEAFHLKVFIQIVGHPIHFPMFKTQSALKPVLRFQPLSHAEDPASKQIKVVNRSALALNVSWIVFLTKPFAQEEEQQEEIFNCYVESNPSVEDSLKSSKNYIPKNTSESVSTLRIPFEMTDSSHDSGKKSFEKTMSSPEKKKRDSTKADKIISMISINEEVKSNGLPGRQDTRIFQVEPKKMDFEPFEEKSIVVTFDPQFGNHEPHNQEFKAVLTGCVKLKPEDEKCPGVYYRPCGINFVSELLDFNAVVETPLVSFEILRGDLKFIVDSNSVVKTASKQIVITRKFLVKNKNQKTLSLKIEIVPGVLFKVTNVNTIDKFYSKYDPDKHILKIEPGHLLEMELQCSVTYKDVIYAFEQLKLNRKKNQCSVSSDDLREKKMSVESNIETKPRREEEPWKRCFSRFCLKRAATDDRSLSHKDSFEINLNRMSSKSDNSICCDYFESMGCHSECEGEFLELPKVKEVPCVPKPFQHETVLEEEISFVQSGVITQTLVAELHLSFPAIKISPRTLDFGNVYLGESAVRYCTFINLTGFPTDFRVKAKCNAAEFSVGPTTGSLPSTNYNSDIGETITVKFHPPQPGYFKEIFYVYCNSDLEFDYFELFVSGFGTWNEKYKNPKMETYTRLQGIYSNLQP